MTKCMSREEKSAAKASVGLPFSEPKDEITKAIIVHNASYSPLLRLPPEIRNNIWRSVLGDRLIHLECIRWSRERSFRHIVCEDDRPEHELVEDSSWTNRDGEVETVWRQPHYDCDFKLGCYPILDPEESGHQSMRLKALRVCRQIYSEANQVLWTTNTFSFNDAAFSFHYFMEERTTLQKLLLRKLRLEMDWVWGEDEPWKRALSTTLTRSLAEMRYLRLQINHSVDAGFHQRAENGENELALFETRHLDLVRSMAKLPLVDVEVYVGERSQPRTLDDYCMAKARKEYAETIRKVLLDPNGAGMC